MFGPDYVRAEFSPCRTWRYVLRRVWNPHKFMLGFILLNPSTADEERDDPTIRRCMNYAKDLGYGGIVLGNLFAFRATDPMDMVAASDPIGPENDAALSRICAETGNEVICGWGSWGHHMARGADVRMRLSDAGIRLRALKLTASGEPGHPLYLKADLQPFEIGAAF